MIRFERTMHNMYSNITVYLFVPLFRYNVLRDTIREYRTVMHNHIRTLLNKELRLK